MAADTWTQHKLTDAMLQRLSKIAHGNNAGGGSVNALIARGLVAERREDRSVVATPAGLTALAQARREGW